MDGMGLDLPVAALMVLCFSRGMVLATHLALAAAKQCLNSTIFNPPTSEALRVGIGNGVGMGCHQDI